jgi:DNA polymerase III subunit epsilon
MAKLFFYDTETTGLYSSKHAIHQIAGAIVINGEVKERFNFRLAPHADALIDEKALAVSNVTEEQIKAYPPAEEAYKQIIKMLGKYVDKFNKQDKFFLVGFNNASFDDDFFRALFTRQGDKYFGSWFWADPIDLRVLAANHLMAERPKMENFQQRTVAKKLGIEVDETKLHDAEYDIDLTRAIYDIVGIMDTKKNVPSVAEVQSVGESMREVLLEKPLKESLESAGFTVIESPELNEPVTEETLRKHGLLI